MSSWPNAAAQEPKKFEDILKNNLTDISPSASEVADFGPVIL